ncbi:MAG: DUF2917 domain-containing protein [Burkholderiaceae bacterium]
MNSATHTPALGAAHPVSERLRAWCGARTGAPQARSHPTRVVHELSKGRTLILLEPLGRGVECLEGCVWITLDHDRRDFIVEAGQTFTACSNQRALIHALETSRVRVAQAAS